MTDLLVRLQGVAKRYPLVHRNADRVRAMLRVLTGRTGIADVAVLQDINLSVRRGESLGIIGENGAGKSTLLKVITGVLNATDGSVEVNGSVAALLELGAGFHPEYTGRENIATAAALMGMSEADIRAKTEAIIEYADIGRYIDEPIKHYSTGMVVRLGFAVVAARRPDILITDEVLAVGDESFQKKCVRWIEDYLNDGGTLLLVSHSMYHVQKLCRHALWMQGGKIQAYGDVYEVTQDYLAYHERKTAKESETGPKQVSADGYRIESVRLNGKDGLTPLLLPRERELRIEADLYSGDDRVPHLAIGVTRADGTAVYGTSSEIDGASASRTESGDYRYRFIFHALHLLPGQYTIKLHALDPEGMRMFDTEVREIVIRGDTRELGMIRLPHNWES
ncbi:MAG: ABC transporter ATP-binding protein [Xanthomonadales bacterium]|nr:ABC transporter ATP-binding protein [Xanthomonadales bacterium]